ncbi:MAG TPA: hypothetical protein DHW02_15965 [Ktedonobacter sp.]|nr:hypothetical protein [Ktedonobacter sp.]
MNMNISTGGPHILFFERDSSLMALLISEFQLAGYECHTARTAVEVFDAIARHPIRVLLVNIAQAAAGRREFWVALDAQRRGRGVQVFTYQCYNLASYGPREADERASSVAVDMEIDGMLGLMSLVERIRERVPATSAAPGTVPRFSRTSSPTTASYPSSSTQSVQASTGLSATTYRPNSLNTQEPGAGSVGVPLHATTGTATNESQQSYTAKIRAVLYSDSRASSANAQVIESVNSRNTAQPVQQSAPSLDSTALQQLAYGQTAREPRESGMSGLAQLSRMVQEFQPALLPEDTGISYTRQPVDAVSSISSQVLRASPIEDLPVDRTAGETMTGEAGRRTDMGTRSSNDVHGSNGHTSHQDTSTTMPLASIAAPMPVVQPAQRTSSATPQSTFPTTAPIEPARPTVPIPAVSITTPLPVVTPSTTTRTQEPHPEKPEHMQASRVSEVADVRDTIEPQVESEVSPVSTEEVQYIDDTTSDMPVADEKQTRTDASERNVEERVQRREQRDNVEMREERQERERTTYQEMALADIIQSLPASPSSSSASSQPQVLNGRPMRSLGSVLIEGHLVPQNRLEVAQNIQRMLRGVDLRYELGEILLMFKLLTPDQLLAATLVSNGLISTQQITALGRIRQELHAIGLEYDLESLLILFRMLTPEQLREARTSWQS